MEKKAEARKPEDLNWFEIVELIKNGKWKKHTQKSIGRNN